jgi:hypothetical protein
VLAFRQGTRDSTTASRLLGVRWGEERSWSTGRETRENVRIVEQPYVSASALEDLEPGTAHLRVPSVDGRRTRVEPVRVALPSMVGHGRAGSPTRRKEAEIPALPHDEVVQQTSYPEEAAALPVPAPDEMLAVNEEAIDEGLERVLRRLDDEGEQDGEWRLWPEAGCNDQGYAVVSVGNRMVRTYRWLYEHEHGALPKGWTLDHTCHNEARARGECAGGKTCRHRRCCELKHLEALPRGENSQRRHEQPGAWTGPTRRGHAGHF